jgi:hypothetical protein
MTFVGMLVVIEMIILLFPHVLKFLSDTTLIAVRVVSGEPRNYVQQCRHPEPCTSQLLFQHTFFLSSKSRCMIGNS